MLYNCVQPFSNFDNDQCVSGFDVLTWRLVADLGTNARCAEKLKSEKKSSKKSSSSSKKESSKKDAGKDSKSKREAKSSKLSR